MKKILIVAALSFFTTSAAVAQVQVAEPWARATVAGQQASGAFMTLTSPRDARLVAVKSPSAGVVEVHEMALENNVMRMRAIPSLALPAGKAVVLRPGGYHVMLMDLKAPLQVGDHVSLTLTFEGADGKREDVEVHATVRPLTSGHDGHGKKGH